MNRQTRIDEAVARGLSSSMGRSLVYWSGQHSVDLTAIAARGGNPKEVDGVIYSNIDERDFCVYRSELIINGRQHEPRKGDTFVEELGSDTIVWQVLPTESEPVFREGDSTRTMIRIHTKRKSG